MTPTNFMCFILEQCINPQANHIVNPMTTTCFRLEQAEQTRLEASRESARIQQTLVAERQHRLQLEQALSEAEEQLKLQQQVTLQEVGHMIQVTWFRSLACQCIWGRSHDAAKLLGTLRDNLNHRTHVTYRST